MKNLLIITSFVFSFLTSTSLAKTQSPEINFDFISKKATPSKTYSSNNITDLSIATSKNNYDLKYTIKKDVSLPPSSSGAAKSFSSKKSNSIIYILTNNKNFNSKTNLIVNALRTGDG